MDNLEEISLEEIKSRIISYMNGCLGLDYNTACEKVIEDIKNEMDNYCNKVFNTKLPRKLKKKRKKQGVISLTIEDIPNNYGF